MGLETALILASGFFTAFSIGRLMAKLDDIRDNQTKLHALVDRLIALINSIPPGTLTPEQDAEIDAIAADQAATLAEDPANAVPPVVPPTA